jgi:DNA-binding NtrC family response regulator
MVLLREQLSRVAALPPWSVLICGEAGTGKTLAARSIHDASLPVGSFETVECNTLSSERLQEVWQGLLRQGGGTLLLRGVEELSEAARLALLPKLPADRTLLAADFHGGGPHVRVISATRLSFARLRTRLPAELLERLSMFIVSIPALRERLGDVAELARHFLDQVSEIRGVPAVKLSSQAAQLLSNYDWDDNVRELSEVMEQVFDLAEQGIVQPASLQAVQTSREARPSSVAPQSIELPKVAREPASDLTADHGAPHDQWSAPPSSGTALVGKRGAFTSLPALEEHVITDIFRECNGNLSLAARTLGIPRSTLRDRLKKYGMAPVSVSKKQVGQ